MSYLPDAPYDEEEEDPIVPTMDMVQHFLNQDHRYADKPADDDDDAPEGPSWD